MSVGRFLRAREHRAAPAASGLALLSRRLRSVRAGVSSSPPAGRGYMARGGGGREEESLGALLSPPPGGDARAALACLTPLCPARPLFTSQARQGRCGLGAPPPPGPAWGLGGGEEEVGGGASLASPEGAAALGLGGSDSSSPSHPPPALSTCGGTRAGGGGAQTGPGDNCQLEAPLGGRRGKGWGRGRTLKLPQDWAAVERSEERAIVAIRSAHA